MSQHALGQSSVAANGTLESKSLGTYELPCSVEAPVGGTLLAHDGHVALGVPPIVVRRSDGVKFDGKFEYPIRGGTAVETIVYLDSKWLLTQGSEGLMRRPLAKLPIVP